MTTERGLQRGRQMVLGEILARNARRTPNKVALIFEERSLTFAQLDERVNRLAAALARRGAVRGSKVAVLMYNRLEVVESYLACHKLGACPVPINFRLAPAEVTYQLQHSDAVGILVDDILDEQVRQTRGEDPGFVLSLATTAPVDQRYERALAAETGEPPDVIVSDEDLAFLMYTSGTTGLPKGAMLTHRNMVANTVNWLLEIGAGPDDVWLSGLPLFHIGGVNGVLPFLYVGGTAVITTSTGFDPAISLRQLAEHGVTMCYFVPTQWHQICVCPEMQKTDIRRLRTAMWGGSQAPRSTLELICATWPSVGIVNAFGQTEMSSNTCFLKPVDALRKMGSVGRPAINVEVRIVDEQMRDVGVGKVGEIVYRGPTVMLGYHRNEQATLEAFAGGWFHSGDLVREDTEGFITVVDRKKDMIISGGENIYPAEVERVLGQHPGVAEVAVVGVPHPKWVETAVAVVVPIGPPPEASELIEFAKQRLASYKKPTAIVFVNQMPRNASGKLLRRELRQQVADLFPAEPT